MVFRLGTNITMESILEHHGLLIGLLMIGVVTVSAWLLGRQANTHVQEFREEHHVRFRGRSGGD